MATQSVLAFSSSRVGSSGYLEQVLPHVQNFLKGSELTIGFIPFADATNNYEGYLNKVKQGLATLQHRFILIADNDLKSLEEADVIMVGGGNTFKVLHHLYAYNMIDLIKEKVQHGTPYIGWSAGSNITGPGIFTTNDMPIIQPQSFASLKIFHFQLNPHYINVLPNGFHGETRNERLLEYLLLNPAKSIVGLPEGTALRLEGNSLTLLGEIPAILFTLDAETKSLAMQNLQPHSDLSWLAKA